ncbi:MAG: 50S ribosomal protein L9 [Clostridiales bacterium]|nr:50S ribosomal protein L9 [Clostridiales bacterium]
MKVILQQDVRGQGKKGQLVDVSDGYARNFLLPRKLAVAATADNINTMKLQEKARKEREAAEKEAALELAQKLKNSTVKVAAKAGAGGKLFGAVTTKEISAAIKEQLGYDIGSKKLVCEPIHAFGTNEGKCKLGYESSGTINVVVTEG